MRKYPVLPLLNRICTKDYDVPNNNDDDDDNDKENSCRRLRIESGTAIVISLLGLGRDPQHFPDPLDYRPERFEEQPPRYNADAYLPFGDGPRTCIGKFGTVLMTGNRLGYFRASAFCRTGYIKSMKYPDGIFYYLGVIDMTKTKLVLIKMVY